MAFFEAWDYYVHDSETGHSSTTDGVIAEDGFNSVSDAYSYTIVKGENCIGNPNNIDAGSLYNKDSASGDVVYNTFTNFTNP